MSDSERETTQPEPGKKPTPKPAKPKDTPPKKVLDEAFFANGFDNSNVGAGGTCVEINVAAEIALAMGEITVKPDADQAPTEGGESASKAEPEEEKDTLPAALGITSIVNVESESFINRSNEKVSKMSFEVEAIPSPGREGGFAAWLSEALQLDGLRFIPDVETITFAQQTASENKEKGETLKSRMLIEFSGTINDGKKEDPKRWVLIFRKLTSASPKRSDIFIQFALQKTVSASVDSLVRCMSPEAADTMSKYVQLALSFQGFAFARCTFDGLSRTAVTLVERGLSNEDDSVQYILKMFADSPSSKGVKATSKTFVSFCMAHCRPFAQLDGPPQLTDDEKKAVKEFRVCTRNFEIIDAVESKARELVKASPAGSLVALVEDVTPAIRTYVENFFGAGLISDDTITALVRQSRLDQMSEEGAQVASAYSGQVAVRVEPVTMSAQRIVFKYYTGYAPDEIGEEAAIAQDVKSKLTIGMKATEPYKRSLLEFTVAAAQTPKKESEESNAKEVAKLAALVNGAVSVLQRLQSTKAEAVSALIAETYKKQLKRIAALGRQFSEGQIKKQISFLDRLQGVNVIGNDGLQQLKDALNGLKKS